MVRPLRPRRRNSMIPSNHLPPSRSLAWKYRQPWLIPAGDLERRRVEARCRDVAQTSAGRLVDGQARPAGHDEDDMSRADRIAHVEGDRESASNCIRDLGERTGRLSGIY